MSFFNDCNEDSSLKNPFLLQVVNRSGLVNYTNIKSGQPIAVTWGVFPGREIVQVTKDENIQTNTDQDLTNTDQDLRKNTDQDLRKKSELTQNEN